MDTDGTASSVHIAPAFRRSRGSADHLAVVVGCTPASLPASSMCIASHVAKWRGRICGMSTSGEHSQDKAKDVWPLGRAQTGNRQTVRRAASESYAGTLRVCGCAWARVRLCERSDPRGCHASAALAVGRQRAATVQYGFIRTRASVTPPERQLSAFSDVTSHTSPHAARSGPTPTPPP